jgi:hypothetical protein
MHGPDKLFGHEDAKSCQFRKTFIEKFCGESVCVNYSYLQVREKIASFCFFETNGPNHLFRPWRPQIL